MNKKTYISIGIVVILLAIGGIVVCIHSKNQSNPTTLAHTKAKAPAKLTACLANKDNPNLKVSPQDQTYIANTAIANIIDVPAGTNVNVYIESYSSNTATGSSVYAGKYGSFNFTAKKTGSSTNNSYQGGWTITNFVACKSA